MVMKFPEHLKYTPEHEWIAVQGDTATVGITDFAQRELGDIVYVDIPSAGKELDAHTPFGTVEAVKTVSELYMPVKGTIIEINPRLNEAPELVNQDPYGEGWMIKIRLSDPSQLNELLGAEQYQQLVGN
ncbi:glycine cleavage system protein GcvH [Thermoflavifilum aggregans]|nr:glycine cleavage system protein GcvH [Thermoflavifilum aggregans]